VATGNFDDDADADVLYADARVTLTDTRRAELTASEPGKQSIGGESATRGNASPSARGLRFARKPVNTQLRPVRGQPHTLWSYHFLTTERCSARPRLRDRGVADR
jgi:hypothetical protein